ncbi:MAG: hypothetical protein AAFQ19_07230 [Pseudomonadota bacterium]
MILRTITVTALLLIGSMAAAQSISVTGPNGGTREASVRCSDRTCDRRGAVTTGQGRSAEWGRTRAAPAQRVRITPPAAAPRAVRSRARLRRH